MTNDFGAWLNGVPVIGFPGSDFGEWLNGVPSVDQGGVTVLPYKGFGTCSSSSTLGGSISASGSGTGTASSSAHADAIGQLAGNGSGVATSSATGSTAFVPPVTTGTWYLRRVSPTQPNVRELVAGMPVWNKKVSSRPPRQRSISF